VVTLSFVVLESVPGRARKIFILVREGNDLYHEMQQSGVINLKGESKAALVYGLLLLLLT
jgi:sulfur transfer protein SufE